MEVQGFMDTSCSRDLMIRCLSKQGAIDDAIVSLFPHGEPLQLKRLQSFFLYGGRRGILRTLIDIDNKRPSFGGLFARNTVCATVYQHKKILGKNQTVLQIHDIEDGPKLDNDIRYTSAGVTLARLRNDLQRAVWGGIDA